MLLVVPATTFSFFIVDATDYTHPNCNGCIVYRSIGYRSTSRTNFDNKCASEALNGVSGEPAVVRSAVASNLIQNSCNIGGSVASGSRCTWWSTGELFSIGSSPTRFSYTRWLGGEPNSGGSEPTIDVGVHASRTWNDSPWGSTSCTMCMFYFDRIGSTKTPSSPTASMTEFGISANQKLYDVQAYSIHYNYANARSYCGGKSKSDAASGTSISGQLAIFRTAEQSAALRNTVFGSTDIPFHTTQSGFGVWLGATRTSGATKTVSLSTGEVIMTNGVCNSADHYCNFSSAAISASWPGAGSGLAMQVNSLDPTWMIQDSSYTMPFACSYEYSLQATIRSTTSSCLDETLQNTISNAEMTIFMSFGDHVNWFTAKSRCQGFTKTNSAGQTVNGELAAVFSQKSNEAIKALADAASYGDRSTNSSSFGLWAGASTDLPGSSSSSPPNDCSLRWNTSTSNFPNRPFLASCSGQCSSSITNGFFCNLDSSTSSNGWPSHEQRGLVVAIKQTQAQWTTLPVSEPLPFVCSFRFVFRQNLTSSLTAELHTTPLTYSAAGDFCLTRQVGLPYNRIQGGLYSWRRGGWGKIVSFVSKHPANDNPVWIGNKHPQDETKCLAVYPRNSSLIYFDCSTALPHVCLFVVAQPTSKTKSRSLSSSSSESLLMTLSSSSSVSPSRGSPSFSSTDTQTLSETSSLSISTSNSSSESITQGTSSQTQSYNPTVSTTVSPSITVRTESSSVSLPSTSSHSATDTRSQSIATQSASSSFTGGGLPFSETATESHRTSTFSSTLPIPPVKKVGVGTGPAGVIGGAQALAALAGSSGGSLAMQQIIILSISVCGVANLQELDTATNPTRLQIGGDDNEYRWWMGAVVGNGAIITGSWLVCGFVMIAYRMYLNRKVETTVKSRQHQDDLDLVLNGAVKSKADEAERRHARNTEKLNDLWNGCVEKVGTLWIQFCSPMLVGSIASILYSFADTGAILNLPIGLLFSMHPFLTAFYVIWSVNKISTTALKVLPVEKGDEEDLLEKRFPTLFWFIGSTNRTFWKVDKTYKFKSEVENANHLFSRYAFVFDYSNSLRFLGVDYFCSFAICVFSAIGQKSTMEIRNCQILVTMMFLVHLAPIGLLCLKQPLFSRMDSFIISVLWVLNAASSFVLMLSYFNVGDETLSDLFLEILSYGVGIVSFGGAFIELCRLFMMRRLLNEKKENQEKKKMEKRIRDGSGSGSDDDTSSDNEGILVFDLPPHQHNNRQGETNTFYMNDDDTTKRRKNFQLDYANVDLDAFEKQQQNKAEDEEELFELPLLPPPPPPPAESSWTIFDRLNETNTNNYQNASITTTSGQYVVAGDGTDDHQEEEKDVDDFVNSLLAEFTLGGDIEQQSKVTKRNNTKNPKRKNKNDNDDDDDDVYYDDDLKSFVQDWVSPTECRGELLLDYNNDNDNSGAEVSVPVVVVDDAGTDKKTDNNLTDIGFSLFETE